MEADNYSKNADTVLYFKIMTADDGGKEEDFVEDFPVLLLNLDKSESEFQKYINHKFS